jgi:hypothetical protein
MQSFAVMQAIASGTSISAPQVSFYLSIACGLKYDG